MTSLSLNTNGILYCFKDEKLVEGAMTAIQVYRNQFNTQPNALYINDLSQWKEELQDRMIWAPDDVSHSDSIMLCGMQLKHADNIIPYHIWVTKEN